MKSREVADYSAFTPMRLSSYKAGVETYIDALAYCDTADPMSYGGLSVDSENFDQATMAL